MTGDLALLAPAALWQLCDFHRDGLAPAALCRPGGSTRRGTAVRFLLLLLFGDCGFTGCGRPARLAPAAFGNSVASLSDGQLCTFGSCCSSVTVASSSAGRWGSSVPAALWRLRGFSTTSTTTCSCSCCSATLWSSLSVGRPSILAPAALRRPCGLHQARGSQLSGFWLLFGNSVASPVGLPCFMLLLLLGDFLASTSAWAAENS